MRRSKTYSLFFDIDKVVSRESEKWSLARGVTYSRDMLLFCPPGSSEFSMTMAFLDEIGRVLSVASLSEIRQN